MRLGICWVLGITVFAVSCLLGSTQSLAQSAYIPNSGSDNVSVIETAKNKVIATIPVGSNPNAFGIFIQPARPAPRFAGTPGKANCYGQSVSALAQQYNGLNAAAAAFEFSSVEKLQNAISEFCKA